jgi:protein phosphatase
MGDSRGYLLRKGQLQALTSDHTIVQLLLGMKEIRPDEAAAHPARDKLTRFVGMPGTPLPEARFLEVEDSDRLLLCSDGLTKMLTNERILEIMGHGASAEDSCKALVSAANQAGGKDNITVLILGFSRQPESLPAARKPLAPAKPGEHRVPKGRPGP